MTHERAGLDALKAGAVAAFADSTADDAVFVDGASVASKEQVVKNVTGFQLRDYTISDVRFVALSADSGLIAYLLAETGTSHGKEFGAKVYVSSLWVRRGRKWLYVFSQETQHATLAEGLNSSRRLNIDSDAKHKVRQCLAEVEPA